MTYSVIYWVGPKGVVDMSLAVSLRLDLCTDALDGGPILQTGRLTFCS